MSSELEAFRDACGGAPAAEQMTEVALRALIAAAQRAWPELMLAPRALAAALGQTVAGGVALDHLDPVEVALARACAAGHPGALRIFDARYLRDLPRVLGHMRLPDDVVAEVAQITRRRLLVDAPEGTPRLVTYAGRGQLRALVRVVATRAALDARRAQGRRREVAMDELSAVLYASADPERAAALGHKQALFRAAFEAAVAELPAADRTLLRMYVLDGVGIDGLAAVAGIHRSTAARRLARIRACIADRTRARLSQAGMAAAELESVIGVVDDGLELTLSRILADPDPEPE